MLVNCVAYEEGRKVADIPKEDISEYLKRPGAFVWVALKDPEPAELEEMRHELGCTSSPSKTHGTATSGPRSRNTAIHCL